MKDHLVLIHNQSNKSASIIQAKWCSSFLSKLQGFTFRKTLEYNEGLVLVEKRDSRLETSIHMLFVWTDLAVIWVNSRNEVVHTVLAKTWRPAYISSKPACYTIEIHPSRLPDFQIGDVIYFEHKNY